MENTENPALRLFNLIKKARGGAYRNKPAFIAWSMIFGYGENLANLSAEEQSEIPVLLCQARKLVDETADAISKIKDIDHNLFLEPFPVFRDLFPKPFDLRLSHNQFVDPIENAHIKTLQFCIHELNKTTTKNKVEKKRLDEIFSEISEVEQSVENADIDNKLKSVLLDLLKTMKISIREYEISGVKSLKEGVSKIVGKLYVEKPIIKGSENTKEVADVFKVLVAFFFVYGVTADTIQILEGIQKILPMLPPITGVN